MKVEDKIAIQELMSRAAYGLDMANLDMLASCFAEDSVFTMRIGDGDLVGPFENREGIMKLMTDSIDSQTDDQRRHVISNLFFEKEGDVQATVISNLTLIAIAKGEIQLLTTAVYRDAVVKVDSDWQLQNRHIDLDLPY